MPAFVSRPSFFNSLRIGTSAPSRSIVAKSIIVVPTYSSSTLFNGNIGSVVEIHCPLANIFILRLATSTPTNYTNVYSMKINSFTDCERYYFSDFCEIAVSIRVRLDADYLAMWIVLQKASFGRTWCSDTECHKITSDRRIVYLHMQKILFFAKTWIQCDELVVGNARIVWDASMDNWGHFRNIIFVRFAQNTFANTRGSNRFRR